MDRSFEKRRRELEAECELPEDLMASVSHRMEEFMQPFVTVYRRHEQVSHAMRFVQGLCSDLECKNAESIAYHFGLERKTIQNFLGESAWDDRPLREELASQVARELGEPDGVLALDPSTFPKSGKQSVGVSRQWCGRLGKVENCQIGVYLGYVSSKGHALVDLELYVPKEWTSDKKRMKRAGVPKHRQRYRSRQELALEVLDRHRSKLPHTWVTADDEFGRPAGFRRALRERNERYMLSVPCNTKIRDLAGESEDSPAPSVRVDRWTAERDEDEWTMVAVRDGEKGPISVHAIMASVETGSEKRSTLAEEVLVVIRYRDRDSQVLKTDYYLSNGDPETPLKEYCRAAKAEQRIEECFQRGKSEVGMADYEVRNWIGWHHHQTLTLLAIWFLTVETRRAEKKDAGHHVQPTPRRHRRDPPQGTRMRFTPRRQMAHRKTTHQKPTRKTLSLEKTQ